jgi:hypothetical protein
MVAEIETAVAIHKQVLGEGEGAPGIEPVATIERPKLYQHPRKPHEAFSTGEPQYNLARASSTYIQFSHNGW